MVKVLIDSDVILDFYFDRMPFSQEASRIIALCERKKLEGYITPLIISNVYYLLKKQSNHKKVIEKIKRLLLIVDVISIDQSVVIEALNSEFKDFEDALQHFSAVKASNIEIIITRNIKDYKLSQLSVMTPTIFIKGFMV